MIAALRRLLHRLRPVEETADLPKAESGGAAAARHIVLGNRHKLAGCPELALESYRSAILCDSANADAHAGAGSVLLQLARDVEAQQHLRRAIEINPNHFEAQSNLIFAVLIRGDYAEGFALHEHRFRVGPAATRASNQEILDIFRNIPAWQGDSLDGRNLLLWTEQGLGDSIMMLRYIPLIAGKFGGTIDVWCEPELVKIFQTVPGIARVLSKDLALSLQPDTVHCPTMSLPFFFKTELATIPNTVPYLTIPAEHVAPWTARLAQHSGLKVGLVWAGNPAKRNDALRSIDFERLAPLLTVPGISFINLQKGPPSQQAQSAMLLDWMSECTDLIDTAALISGLDLVISVDTSIAHLAGALGKPVWLLNRFESEWRWMFDREDSLWYPSVRIFRQPALHNWDHPVEKVREALVALI
jgi:hypothetical protein